MRAKEQLSHPTFNLVGGEVARARFNSERGKNPKPILSGARERRDLTLKFPGRSFPLRSGWIALPGRPS